MENKSNLKSYENFFDSDKILLTSDILKQINKTSSIQKSLSKVTNQYTKSILPLYLNENFLNNFSSLNKTINSVLPQVRGITNMYSDSIKVMIDSLNMSHVVSDYINKYQSIMKGVLDALKSLPSSQLSGTVNASLDKYYWVIPFEYNYFNIDKITKYKSRVAFEKYMLKYFNDNRVKRLFIKLRKQFKEKDKKELLRQIENSYFNNDYAICITSLLTLFDGATLVLLQPDSHNQHKSHKVIEAIKKEMDNNQISVYGYELYLRTDILNNFINKLYPENYDLKKSRRKLLLSRDINSHGVRYLNNKVNVLRLLNALHYCNEIIQDTNLQESFVSTRRKGEFILINKM